ncbi:MAG: PhnD/SsuA/transferrin family substrate-binding protein [Rhodospirillaceae bacterium]|jgi:ABC-type phosphate/phosphonate transport system substrate-binding protein|nr:PhnD/SsuA/transferrin family substrate-binding protein [Rhodospirillaceae bacterium]MBT3491712.1 PhnD/SsuA/transferrin family substrate-binding protein [Rhodospirillaceae bacterium]MBT3783232.1 PhnD/SsuA/transferrin family substrate-binding protein [Rhodospirillaceae bacterium]MBT3978228.1 PhnD/SsuA/transferrin family substrate-binding protein [Rhodospirillaceae bacterium]MBT4168959.1 PhnD/SsuA/transferrin family substrate-binding protein [Rhodospirillaceae bacterium]
MKLAGLTMYDLDPVREATDAWWAGLAKACREEGFSDVPDELWRGGPREDLWRSPDLLLSQTCGYPLLKHFMAHLTLLATPIYGAEGCYGANYCSLIVVRANSDAATLEDLRGGICAINDWDSQSGMNVLRHTIAPLARNGRFFGEVKVAGKHQFSIAMIAGGEADVAAIDCVTHGLMSRHDPDSVAGTRVLAQTQAAPALPYVTSKHTSRADHARLRAALNRALQDPELVEARDALLIQGFADPTLADYKIMLEMEVGAAAAGYPVLQ